MSYLSIVFGVLLALAQPTRAELLTATSSAEPDTVSLSTTPILGDTIQIVGTQGILEKGHLRYDSRWPSYSILHVDCTGTKCNWGQIVGYVTPDTEVSVRQAVDGAMLSQDVLPFLVGKDVVAIWEYVDRGEGEANERFAVKLDILVYQDDFFAPKDRPDEHH
jgi:hypothetical protein